MNYQVNNPFMLVTDEDIKKYKSNLACNNGICRDASQFIDVESYLKLQYCKERSRTNLDEQKYVPHGSHVDKGFENLDISNFLYYSDTTRNEELTIRDTDIFKHEQSLYNWPNTIDWRDLVPKDTRNLNHQWIAVDRIL